VQQVISNNSKFSITGVLLIKNGHFFQIIEGENQNIDILYTKIAKDIRHNGIIKLLDNSIDARIFDGYNGGEFDVFKEHSDLKRLYLYFNWIENANYLPAEEIMKLITNFLKNNR